MMKNFIKRAIVCAGVVASAMALSSAVVFAATQEYVVNIEANVAAGNYIIQDILTSNNQVNAKTNSKEITKIVTTGTTSIGQTIALDKFKTNYAHVNSNKKNVTVQATKGQTVGIYYAISDSSGYADTKLKNLTISDGTNTSTAASKTYGELNYFESVVTNDDGTITFTPSDSRLNVFAVTITTESNDPEASISDTAKTITTDEEFVLTASSDKINNPTYSWSTGSDVASVTVDPDDSTKATVKGLSAGSLDVTVTVKGTDSTTGSAVEKTATCTVTVIEPVAVTNVTVSLADSSIYKDHSTNATATVNEDATDKSITWSSSDKDVATVDASGKVTGVSAGTASIIATSSNGITGSATVTVENEPEAFVGNDDVIWDIKAYTAGTDMGNGMKALIETQSGDSDKQIFTDDAGNNYTYSSATMNAKSNGKQFEFTPNKDGVLTVLAKINSGKSGSLFGINIESSSETRYIIRRINVVADDTYEFNFSNTKPPIYYLGYSATASQTTADQATSIATQTGITAPEGLEVDALYTEDADAGYVIFAFKNNSTLKNANSVTFTAGGEDTIIDSLYENIEFADKSVYSKDGYLLTAFSIDKGNAVTSITGTFTVA